MLSCEYFLDSASERGMTRTRHPAHDAGSRRGQTRYSFTRSLPVFTSCGIPTLRLLSGFRVGARNDKNASPRTQCGVQKRTSETFIYGGCRYLPHEVFPLCKVSLDSASGRGMTERVTPHLDSGARRGQTRHSFTGSLPVFTSCCILPLRLLSGFRVGARNDKNASPRTRCGVQKRTSETFIYRVFAGIYLMRYSHFAATLWIPRRSAE